MDKKTLIKAQLDRETIASILIFIGINITRDFKFADDLSFSISRTGLIRDFGRTQFYGDIFDFIMKEKQVNFKEAIDFVGNCLGVNNVA